MSFVLDTNELIIENVLKFLPGKQLKEFMKINQCWKSAGQRLLRKRVTPDWFHWNNKEKERSVMFSYSYFLDNMHAVPKTVITFTSECLAFQSSSRKNPKKCKFDFSAFLEKEIQDRFDNVVITSYTTVGNSGPGNNNVGTPEYFKSSAATSCFWPERADLKIRMVPSLEDLRRGLESEEGLDLKLVLFLFMTPGEIIKEEVWPINCIVAGCKIASMSCNGNVCPNLGIAFFGKQNIKVSSVIVEENEQSHEEVEKKLMKFIPFLKKTFCGNDDKSNFDVRKFSHRIHAFLFACVDRLHSGIKRNVDLESFTKVLPGVRLSGLSGYGEIGMNVTDEDDVVGDRFVMRDHLFAFSSVFVLIAF